MQFNHLNLIDSRFTIRTETRKYYFVQLKFGTKKTSFEIPKLCIELIPTGKSKNEQMFTKKYTIDDEFISGQKRFTIKRLNPKGAGCLVDLEDLETNRYDKDINEIEKMIRNYYSKKYNTELEDLEIKLSFDGTIKYAINIFKDRIIIVLHPDLKDKVSEKRIRNLILKKYSNPNIKFHVIFQYGKYIPKKSVESERHSEGRSEGHSESHSETKVHKKQIKTIIIEDPDNIQHNEEIQKSYQKPRSTISKKYTTKKSVGAYRYSQQLKGGNQVRRLTKPEPKTKIYEEEFDETLKDKIRNEIRNEVKEELERELEKEIQKKFVKVESKVESKVEENEIKDNEVKEEIKEEIKEEVKEEIKENEVKEEIKEEVKEDKPKQKRTRKSKSKDENENEEIKEDKPKQKRTRKSKQKSKEESKESDD